MTGICSDAGRAEASREIVYGSVVDYYAAALVAAGVASALFERERSGQGQLRRGVAAAQCAGHAVGASGLGRGRVPRGVPRHALRRHHRHPPHAPRATCTCRPTRRISGGAVRADGPARSGRRPALRLGAQARRARRGRSVPLAARGAGCGPQRPASGRRVFGEAVPLRRGAQRGRHVRPPQVLAQEMVSEFEHPQVGRYRGLASAFSFGEPDEQGVAAEPLAPARSAPVFGQHTDAWLTRAGYSEAEIGALRAQGAVA
jgi:crotonobetainyl-CoA:carnitine CoA-transferase CaiB-like acyl-CoA transferase